MNRFIHSLKLTQKLILQSRDYDRGGITKTQYTYGLKNVFVRKPEDGKIDQLSSVGFLHQLRKVEFLYFSGYESEMEMIKCLLQNAVILDLLFLTYEEPNKSDGFALQKELSQGVIAGLPRASAHARIVCG